MEPAGDRRPEATAQRSGQRVHAVMLEILATTIVSAIALVEIAAHRH